MTTETTINYTPEFLPYDTTSKAGDREHFIAHVLGELRSASAEAAVARNRDAGKGPGIHVALIVEGEQLPVETLLRAMYGLMKTTIDVQLPERVKNALLGSDCLQRIDRLRRILEDAEWAAEALAANLIRAESDAPVSTPTSKVLVTGRETVLRVEAAPAVHISEACEEAVLLAKHEGLTVLLNFNGVEVCATADGHPDRLAEGYHRDMNRRR